jgi:hypothetical protein
MVNYFDKPGASRRHRRRLHAQRGAAVFIVVMVLTLLTAVGVFAVRSASLADVAAGYDREASQASLIAQYATVATAAYLAGPSGNSIVTNIHTISPYCQMNMGVTKDCFILYSAPIEASTLSLGNEDLFETSSSSLNANGNTVADFDVELTDPFTPPGVISAGNQSAPVQITVTAVAQVQQAGACVNPGSTTWNAGQQMVRSYISAGNQ